MTVDMIFFAVTAVVLLGTAKGGFGGVGAPVALPIMSLGVAPDLALGALLPLLIAMDAVSVTAHRKNTDLALVKLALPGAVAGVLLGTAFVSYVPQAFVGGLVGVLAIGFAIMALTGAGTTKIHGPDWLSGVFGGLSGFTSSVAHAGGPPIHIYLLSRLPDQARFVATSASFMAGVNLLKLLPFILFGVLDREALILSLWLAPLAVASAYGGVVLSRVLSKKMFKYGVNSLMLLAGTKLIIDAVFAG